MASIQLISRVLVLLGRQPIGSIDEDPDGPKIGSIIDAKTAILLQNFNWTFATRYQELAQATTTTNPEFKYEYPFTPEVSRVLEVYKPYTDTDSITRVNRPLEFMQYAIQGSSVFTNIDRILIKFITKNVDIPTQNAAVSEMIAFLSASEGAYVLNENQKQAEQYLQVYKEYEMDARRNDVQAGEQRNWRATRRLY